MKHEKDKMESDPGLGSTPDSHRVKYEKLGGDQLIAQLRQNDELPKGSLFRVDLPELAHPICMRAGTSDLWVFDQIFLYREMETDFGQNLAFIIDAGANIGLTSVYLANRFPNARIPWRWRVDRQNATLRAAVFWVSAGVSRSTSIRTDTGASLGIGRRPNPKRRASFAISGTAHYDRVKGGIRIHNSDEKFGERFRHCWGIRQRPGPGPSRRAVGCCRI
jgi:hypothetical protein